MAKKALKSKNDRSSSTYITSAKNPSTASNHQTALRVKSSEYMKKTAEESVVSEKEKRPKSKSILKSKLKKKTKIKDKMPKKPSTAFFYFFEPWFLNQRILPASFVAEIECPVEKCMARLQELQLTVAGGSKVISGVSLSPRSTRGYMRTSLRCKQESLRMKNSSPRKSPVRKFSATAG
ncbi:hypothetical protein Gotur_021181, partial [Gossypium turneri]